jgi:4-diphosphocytidyl-2-C-methyl-D-erythritol kinase
MPAPNLPLSAPALAKINLGLFLGPVREDGRHELVTVMQSISLADELTLREAPAGSVSDEVVCPGVPGPPDRNLAAVALAAFRAATGWDAPPLELSIVKRVPVAAGLGGGSGDAAAALRLAARASGLGDDALLLELARGLGADVPAQVRPGRWLASSVGELLLELPDPHPPFGVLALPAAGELSTAEVYAQADCMGLARNRRALEERHRELREALAGGMPLPPGELLGNDLQDAARALCPKIDEALAQAHAVGADVVLVSGSGPTVLGLFAGPTGPQRARGAAAGLADRTPAPVAAEPAGECLGRAEQVSPARGDLPMRHNSPPETP